MPLWLLVTVCVIAMALFLGLIRLGSDLQRRLDDMGRLQQTVDALWDTLRTPQGRGHYGEMSLERLLHECLPERFVHKQWSLPNGNRVDIAIETPQGVVPIDAKFSLPANADQADCPKAMRAFRKVVTGRAQEIRDRYIAPPDTVPFAFMYLPAESIYLRVVSDSELHHRLLQMSVVPGSPSTLLAFVEAARLGLHTWRGFEDEVRMGRELAALQRRVSRLREQMGKAAVHFTRGQNRLSEADRELGSIEDCLRRIDEDPADLPPRRHAL